MIFNTQSKIAQLYEMGQGSVNTGGRTMKKERKERMLIFTLRVDSTDTFSFTTAEMTYSVMEVHFRQN